MQIEPGFRICTYVNKVAGQGVDILMTDNALHFCLLYHLNGVFNTHCGGQHLHRLLSRSEFGRLSEWCDRLCGRDEVPPVWEIESGSRIQASTLSAITNSPKGSHRGRATTGGGGAECNTTPPYKS